MIGFESESVGVEPYAGTSSAPYQDVKALRGPTTGTLSALKTYVPIGRRDETANLSPCGFSVLRV